MADLKLKKFNGTAWEDAYPETTVGQIVATGTPSSTTFLRGDGTWATVEESGNQFVNISGDTMTGNLEISNTLPKITFTDTDNNSDFNISNNNGVFTIGDTTNQIDRFKVYSSGDVAMPVDAKFTIGESTTVNEAKIVLDVSNAGHPQIGLAENNDASWAIGVDDTDNGFKIHGAASATIPTIAGLGTPHFELDTTGNLYLQKRLYLTTNSYIEYNATNDSIDFFFT